MPLGPNPAHRAHRGPSLSEDEWRLHVEGGWTNDNFNPRIVPERIKPGRWADDDGFTNDLFVSAGARKHDLHLEVSAANRMLTERAGMRRADVVDLAASVGHSARLGDFALSATAIAGVTSTGNYAGSAIQDRFHATVGYGRRLGSTKGNTFHRTALQDTYDPKNRYGATFGLDTSLSYGLLADHVVVEAGVDSQLALGQTGMTYVRPHTGVEANLSYGVLSAYGGGRLELTRAVTNDPALQINGGYNTRHPYVTAEVNAGVQVWIAKAGVRARYNENGTGFHTAGFFAGIDGTLP